VGHPGGSPALTLARIAICRSTTKRSEIIMPFFRSTEASLLRSTSNVYRGFGGIADIREVSDKASHVGVVAFPVARLEDIVASQSAIFACYILAGLNAIYVGETNNIGRRLSEHDLDADKEFAHEAFVLYGVRGLRFTREIVLYLQYYLTEAAEAAGIVKVIKGNPPRLPEIDALDEPLFERLLADALRLLFDAGLHAFDSAHGRPEPESTEKTAAETMDAEDSGQMEIGVELPRNLEYELLYADTIWARGYYNNAGQFVVAAGSDFRVTTNRIQAPITDRRDRLRAADGVLAEIPGASDRLRLMTEVRFPSMAIAAKVICGAHVDSSRWRPRDVSQLPVLRL
jgi:hypothetical protein